MTAPQDAEARRVIDGQQDALNRMRRAYERGTGCHLTADMIAELGVSIIGQIWSEDDPRLTERAK